MIQILVAATTGLSVWGLLDLAQDRMGKGGEKGKGAEGKDGKGSEGKGPASDCSMFCLLLGFRILNGSVHLCKSKHGIVWDCC